MMCELFCFSGSSATANTDLTPYLKEFFSHCPRHPNGWGLADFSVCPAVMYKESLRAGDSELLSALLRRGVSSSSLFAHIRCATEGSVRRENSHPFRGADATGRTWTLIHNGTIFDGLELIKYRAVQKGDTDSERILLYLLDRINCEINRLGRDLTPLERCGVVDAMVRRLSYRNKLNLMIHDGARMYVHYNMKNTLYCAEDQNGICVATTPLGEEDWRPLPLTVLSVYERGKLVFRGGNHKNEYLPGGLEELHRYEYYI